MTDKIFFDTNIIIYSYSAASDRKNTIGQKVISNSSGIISSQVMQEMCNVLIKKFDFDEILTSKTLLEMQENFIVSINKINTITHALQIHFKYQYSYYDSLIIAAALDSNCTILYSEDLKHNQIIENTLTILNPFINEN